MDIQEFLGIKPNNIQRRVLIAATVFGAVFMIDVALILSFGLLERGSQILSIISNTQPFSAGRIIAFILILSMGVFISLVYYVVLPMGAPPPIHTLPELRYDF